LLYLFMVGRLAACLFWNQEMQLMILMLFSLTIWKKGRYWKNW